MKKLINLTTKFYVSLSIGALFTVFISLFLFSFDSYYEKPKKPTEPNFVYQSEIDQTPDILLDSEIYIMRISKPKPCSMHALICSTLITKMPSETLMKIKSTIPKIKTRNYKIHIHLEKRN